MTAAASPGRTRRRPRTAVLTFDEGWLDGLTTMMPLLARPDIGTSFFVCPGGGTGSIRS